MWRTLLVLACGCRQLWGLGGTPGLEGDAAHDTESADENHLDGAFCFGHFLDQPYCFDAAPTGDLVVTGPIETTSDPRCDPSIPSACVIAAHTVTVNSQLVGTGERPLVLLGTLSITIAITGSIDVSSHGNIAGAGADLPGCNPNGAADNSGGGSGGSFGGAGGNGGMGAGNGASAGATLTLASVRGGCPGGPGTGGSSFGNGGFGGGAIYLIGGDSLTIDGAIDASGTGGQGSPVTNGGGGGGGSGGLVILDAPSINLMAMILASGGGGGGGAGAAAGSNGSDPINSMRANGGDGGNSAARGGRGSGAGMLGGEAGLNSASAAGGGGGGGGAGYVKVVGGAMINNPMITPPPS
jgi:hypothetical protein